MALRVDAICILVSLICIVALASYWPLVAQLRHTEPHPSKLTGAEIQWRGTTLPKLKKRKQVSWLHLHKFGGTFMAKMAGLQGEVFPPGSINANWMPDFCSTPPGQRVLCAERTVSDSTESGISWSAMERELDEGDFCDGALMGTMLREPLSALQSVLSHDRFDKVAILETLRGCSEKNLASHFMYQPPAETVATASPCLPVWDTYQHFDNFATRTLAGAYSQSPCSITRSHLEAAKSQLQRMDVLTILEELNDHLPQLQDVFQWNLTLVEPWRRVNRNPKRHPGKSVAVGSFTSEEMAFLKGLNAIDLELYEFAFSLARNMTRQAKESIAKRGDAVLPPAGQSQDESKLMKLRQKVEARLRLRGRPI